MHHRHARSGAMGPAEVATDSWAENLALTCGSRQHTVLQHTMWRPEGTGITPCIRAGLAVMGEVCVVARGGDPFRDCNPVMQPGSQCIKNVYGVHGDPGSVHPDRVFGTTPKGPQMWLRLY